MIKIFKMSLAGLLFSVATISSAGMITPNPTAPSIAGTAHILQDYDSGHILMSENADERLPPASITKLMTSYVVSQEIHDGNIKLDDEVLISEKAWRMIGSRSFIEVNTKVTVEALLRGMIVQSGNDAAVALAEHVAGSEEVFAQMMNQYAQKLGMVNTNYQNATGLPGPEHYTTAHDIAILSAALIRDFPEHYQWYAEKEYTYNGITQHNRNKLLWRDNTVDGLKTGHTEEAGYCLVASAKRDDMRLISVVMGTTSEAARAAETQKLLTWGFRFFETKTFYQPGQVLAEESVWKGAQDKVELGLQDGLMLTLPKGQADKLEAGITLNKPILAPIQVGDVLGEVEVKLGDEVVHKAPLVALSAVEEAGLLGRLWDSIRLFFYGLFD